MQTSESRRQLAGIPAWILACILALGLATPQAAQAAPTIKDYQVDWGINDPQVGADDLPVDDAAYVNIAALASTAQAVFDWIDANWGSLGDVTGPGSSTEHALARFADTTGKVIEELPDWQGTDSGQLQYSGSASQVLLVDSDTTGTTANIVNQGTDGLALLVDATDGTCIYAANLSIDHPSITAANTSSNNAAHEIEAGRLKATQYLDLAERTDPGSLPADPETGDGRLYALDDGTLHYINDASLDVELGAAFSGIILDTDLGTPSVLADGDTLGIYGGAGIDSSNSGDSATLAVDETVSRILYTTPAEIVKQSFTTETVVANVTIGANEFNDGTILRFKAYGNIGAFTGTPTFTFRLRYNGTGGTALCTWTRASLSAGAPSEKFELDADINVHSLGSSGTCRAAGLYECIDRSLAFQHVQSNGSTAVPIATDASKTYDLTVECSASHAFNKVTFDIVSIERLN